MWKQCSASSIRSDLDPSIRLIAKQTSTVRRNLLVLLRLWRLALLLNQTCHITVFCLTKRKMKSRNEWALYNSIAGKMMFWGYGLFLQKKPGLALISTTLHEFHRSSEKAINKTLEKIFQRHGTPVSALKGEYSRVLKAKMANAFSDGKQSFDYRRERFASVLTHFSLPQDELFMTELLGSYESTLMTSLELKCGALNLLCKALL